MNLVNNGTSRSSIRGKYKNSRRFNLEHHSFVRENKLKTSFNYKANQNLQFQSKMNAAALPRNGEFIQQFLIKNLTKRPRYLINLGLAFGLVPAMALVTLYHRHNGPDIVPRLRNANCEPWNDGTWDNKQYRFYSPIDHTSYQHPRPKF